MNYDYYDYKDEELNEDEIFKNKLKDVSSRNKKIFKLVFGILATIYAIIGILFLVIGSLTDIIGLVIPGIVFILLGLVFFILIWVLPNAQDRLSNMTVKEYEERFIKGNNYNYYDRYSSTNMSLHSAYTSTKIEALEKRIENLEAEIKNLKNGRNY